MRRQKAAGSTGPIAELVTSTPLGRWGYSLCQTCCALGGLGKGFTLLHPFISQEQKVCSGPGQAWVPGQPSLQEAHSLSGTQSVGGKRGFLTKPGLLGERSLEEVTSFSGPQFWPPPAVGQCSPL